MLVSVAARIFSKSIRAEGWRSTDGSLLRRKEELARRNRSRLNHWEQRVNPAVPFIRRPVATTLITIAIAIAGLFAFLRLPVAPMPQVDYPTILVSASMPAP